MEASDHQTLKIRFFHVFSKPTPQNCTFVHFDAEIFRESTVQSPQEKNLSDRLRFSWISLLLVLGLGFSVSLPRIRAVNLVVEITCCDPTVFYLTYFDALPFSGSYHAGVNHFLIDKPMKLKTPANLEKIQ